MGLEGRHILIGVTGSIAAYKTAPLIRLLVKEGAEVRVLMTEAAKAFITPLTLATLSRNPIGVDFYNPENGDWNSHVSYGIWADVLLIAPASANTLGKMAAGIADNLLLTSYLSAKCPVMAAPAMDLDMYRHPATQRNLASLQKDGVIFIEPGSGELASGLVGKGRMAEPEEIVSRLRDFFTASSDFKGKKVLVSAGPTYEKLDPVRFIGNYSSGKMGYAIADEFARRGAQVRVVSGPVSVVAAEKGVEVEKVESAAEMYEAMLRNVEEADIVVSCAAVADFTPGTKADSKIKREGNGGMTLVLQPTRDIAAELGRRKRNGQFFVGFALETDHERENAEGKLQRKNLDMIVLNSLKDEGAGFGYDTNKVTIIDRNGNCSEFSLKCKKEVACDIVNMVKSLNDEK